MLSPGKKNISLKNSSQSVYDISIIKALKKYMTAESTVERQADGVTDISSLMPLPAKLSGRNNASGKNTGFKKPASGAGLRMTGMNPEKGGFNISKYGSIDKKTGSGPAEKVRVTYKGVLAGAKTGASGLFAKLFVPDSGHIGKEQPEYSMTKKSAPARGGDLKQETIKVAHTVYQAPGARQVNYLKGTTFPHHVQAGLALPEKRLSKETVKMPGREDKTVFSASAPRPYRRQELSAKAGGYSSPVSKADEAKKSGKPVAAMPREVMIYPDAAAAGSQNMPDGASGGIPLKKETFSGASFSAGKKFIMHSSLSQTRSQVKNPPIPELVPGPPSEVRETSAAKKTAAAFSSPVETKAAAAPALRSPVKQRPSLTPARNAAEEPSSYDNFDEDNYSKYLLGEEEKESLFYEGNAVQGDRMFMQYPKKQSESGDFNTEDIDMELKPLVEDKEFVKPDQKK